MAPTRSTSHQGAAEATLHLSATPQSLDWSKKIIPAWHCVVANKNRAAAELSTVNTTLNLMAEQVANLPESEAKALFTTQLSLVQPIVEAQVSSKRDEAQQTQAIIDGLKAESIVPKTSARQRGVILQLLQVMNSTDAEMKVGDLLERLQGSLLSVRDPPLEHEAADTVAGNAKIIEVSSQKQHVTNTAKSEASAARSEPTATKKQPVARSMDWIKPAAERNKKINYRTVRKPVPKKTVSTSGAVTKRKQPAKQVRTISDEDLDKFIAKDEDDCKPVKAQEVLTREAQSVNRKTGSEKQKSTNNDTAMLASHEGKQAPQNKVPSTSKVAENEITPEENVDDEDMSMSDGHVKSSSSNDEAEVALNETAKERSKSEVKKVEDEVHGGKVAVSDSEKTELTSSVPTSKKISLKDYLASRKEGQKGVARKVARAKKDNAQALPKEDAHDFINDDDHLDNVQGAKAVPNYDVKKQPKNKHITIDSDSEGSSSSLSDITTAPKKHTLEGKTGTSTKPLDQQAVYLQQEGVDMSNILFGSRRRASGSSSESRDKLTSAGEKRKRLGGDDGPAPTKKIVVDRNIAMPRVRRVVTAAMIHKLTKPQTRRSAPTANPEMMGIVPTPE
ncbi:hypothetical protein N0V83_003023 [Neocucurbitaria cava]|uniref:Uncharacterized protein n=1 Tax=Neocucurbitaria cava TaxID=798079 RepID=A0A9W9CQ28_9PLEO|nr:hypothetical protein N0V83_003023 [Neocucurbitaria cava]